MILKPFEVETSIIAPAFGHIGLGVQYRSSVSAEVYIFQQVYNYWECFYIDERGNHNNDYHRFNIKSVFDYNFTNNLVK